MSTSFPAEYFSIQTITSPIDLSNDALLPRELRHAFRVYPHHRERVQALVDAGGIFEIHTLQKTPEVLLHAADRISRSSQEHTLTLWLSRLVREEDIPTYTASELHGAEREGVDLYQAARLLMAYRDIGKRFVCQAATQEDEERCLQELNAALRDQSIEEFLHRLHQDANTIGKRPRTLFLQGVICLGPLAYVFEHWMPGVGKVCAALTHRLWGEGKELHALHAAGSTWHQLIKRSKLFFLASVLTIGGIVLSQLYLSQGRDNLAGALFGVSVMLLPCLMALGALQKTYQALLRLKSAGKLRVYERSLRSLALQEHGQRSPYVSAYLGMCLAPILSVLAFRYIPNGSQNGWVLVLLSMTDTWVNELLTLYQNQRRRGVWTGFRRRFEQKRRALDAAYKMR